MDGSLLAVTVSDFLPLKICGCNSSAESKGDGLSMHTPTRAWIINSLFFLEKNVPDKPFTDVEATLPCAAALLSVRTRMELTFVSFSRSKCLFLFRKLVLKSRALVVLLC